MQRLLAGVTLACGPAERADRLGARLRRRSNQGPGCPQKEEDSHR